MLNNTRPGERIGIRVSGPAAPLGRLRLQVDARQIACVDLDMQYTSINILDRINKTIQTKRLISYKQVS